MGKLYVNISVYKFVPLDNLQERKQALRNLADSLNLKGTILVSPEGINMFLAGLREEIDGFFNTLKQQAEFADLEPKESFTDYQPFSRMLVKVKKEIIAFGVEGIAPHEQTSEHLKADKLKEWLDEGRPVTLLDVRNDYEVEVGTFKNALPIGVDTFRDFPDKVRQLPEEMKEQPIVMFCTGGIRCEKAGPFMENEGFKEIYQLDGGILKYFEEVGADHYDGECFVFDHRVAVDPELSETDTEQCFRCQHPLTLEDQQSDKYQIGHSCPYCYQTADEKFTKLLKVRENQISEVTNPLPGSQPYDNLRPMNVPKRCDKMETLEFLVSFHPHLGEAYWKDEIEKGRILWQDKPLNEHDIVRSGRRIEHLIPANTEPDVNGNIQVIYEDDCLFVVNKPAPLPMHPSGRFNRNSLVYILNQVLSPDCIVRAAHRLDANTTGVVVLSKKQHISSKLQPQFTNGEVQKKYLARVIGSPEQDEFECNEEITSEPGKLGARETTEDGLTAKTIFKVLKRFEDGTSLLEVTPKTGRTNQIRIHTWHLGFPIQGDPVYLPEQKIGMTQTLSVEAPPMCLHAESLTITHPKNNEKITLKATAPDWVE